MPTEPRPRPVLLPHVVLLAAGRSSRMGTPKGLVAVNGRAWIEHQLDAIRAAGQAGVGGVIVVLGFDSERYVEAVPQLVRRAVVTVNVAPHHGPFSSLQVGLARVPTGPPAYVLPIDVPAPSPAVWRALSLALAAEPGEAGEEAGADREGSAAAAVPVLAGSSAGGHPVLLSAALIARVRALAPTSRLDHVLREHDVQVSRVVVDDVRVRMNLNAPGDWARLPRGTFAHATSARDRKRSGRP